MDFLFLDTDGFGIAAVFEEIARAWQRLLTKYRCKCVDEVAADSNAPDHPLAMSLKNESREIQRHRPRS